MRNLPGYRQTSLKPNCLPPARISIYSLDRHIPISSLTISVCAIYHIPARKLIIKMAPTFTHEFNHAGYKGKVEVPTGIFINGEWASSVDKNAKTIE